MKLRVGDTVQVIAGSEKGKTGEILAIKGNRVVVEGVKKVTKHVKPSQADPEGGIITVEAPIDASNVAYYDTKLRKSLNLATKLKMVKKVRVNKKTGAVIENKKK